MTFYNTLKDCKGDFVGTAVFHHCLQTLCTLLAPMAPHITSEIWEALAKGGKELSFNIPTVRLSPRDLRKLSGDIS